MYVHAQSSNTKDLNIQQKIARVRIITIKMLGCRRHECPKQSSWRYGHTGGKNKYLRVAVSWSIENVPTPRAERFLELFSLTVSEGIVDEGGGGIDLTATKVAAFFSGVFSTATTSTIGSGSSFDSGSEVLGELASLTGLTFLAGVEFAEL